MSYAIIVSMNLIWTTVRASPLEDLALRFYVQIVSKNEVLALRMDQRTRITLCTPFSTSDKIFSCHC